MEGNGRLSLVVGAFVLAAMGALIITILSLSSQQGLWSDRYRLIAYYENVQGLIANAPVWLAGTQVGRVESVKLSMRDSVPAVLVVLQVDRSVQDRIRTDSQASIGTIGLLGDRYVEISLGTSGGQVVEDGGEIATISPVDINRMMDVGAAALDNIATLAENLNTVVVEFGENTGGRRLAQSVSAVAEIIEEVQDGSGLLHSLVYDDYEGVGVESIERSLASLEEILFEVAHGEGLLHSLVYDTLTEQDLVLEFLQAGSNLNSILAKVDSGEGTLGMFVNDPTLYEDLKLLVGGANRSAVVRTMVRMSTEAED